MPDNHFANSLKPFKRESISNSILNVITDSILSGTLKPGDKLPTELELAENLGVGRNSVREAMKMLSSLGVVEVKRGAGMFIAKSMPSSILDQLVLSLAFHQGTSKELIELRFLIEIGVAELVIEKASEEEITRVEEANLKLKEAAEKKIDDSSYLRDLDLNVHYTLLELTENSFIMKIAKAIYRLFFASIEKTVEMDPYRAYKNHKLYIDALKKRDKELLRKKIREALSEWVEFVTK